MPPGVFTERLKKESSLETEAFLGVGSHEVAVEAGDVVHADAFRAGSFTFILVRAVAEAFRFHLLHHGQDALGTFRLNSKWSCCGKPKYPYEYHKWDDGICTVCGCICEHSISSPANCHERARCHTCGIWYGQIDPHNHDFYPSGTYTSGEKEPTCTEEGYTGDTVCWNCRGVVDYGTVIPAKGHDTSRWKANCREPAYCSVCKQYCGKKDPDNHTSSPSDISLRT